MHSSASGFNSVVQFDKYFSPLRARRCVRFDCALFVFLLITVHLIMSHLEICFQLCVTLIEIRFSF